MHIPRSVSLLVWLPSLALFLASCGDKEPVADVVLGGPVDADGDGYPEEHDCDDNDASRNPSATEICDGIDQDCDDEIDEDATGDIEAWEDLDGDGYGDDDARLTGCTVPDGAATEAGDCNDDDDTIHPDAEEICDAIDNDCDGLLDDEDDSIDASGLVELYEDADGDGHGALGTDTILACEDSPTAAPQADDCDDNNAGVFPGAARLESIDACMEDVDNDDWGAAVPTSAAALAGSDCDDDNVFIRPDQTETCDGIDNDCDGDIDEGC
jgi:hypothetical protein